MNKISKLDALKPISLSDEERRKLAYDRIWNGDPDQVELVSSEELKAMKITPPIGGSSK